jgi:hypothetical protein
MDFDLAKLTIGEMCDVEDLVGADTAAGISDGKITPKLLRALALVALRRSDPDATLDDVNDIHVTDLTIQ